MADCRDGKTMLSPLGRVPCEVGVIGRDEEVGGVASEFLDLALPLR